jgi:hypothetical protein
MMVQQGDLASTGCGVLAAKFQTNAGVVSQICIKCFIDGSEPLKNGKVSTQAWNGGNRP